MQRDTSNPLRAELAATFPVAGNAELIWFLDALGRIVNVIGCARPYQGAVGSVDVIHTLRGQVVAALPEHQGDADPDPDPMRGKFGLADALIGTGKPEQPLGIPTFRAVLWIAVRLCHDRNLPYESRAMQIASALRSAAWRPDDMASHALDSHLTQLGRQTDIAGAITVLDRLTATEHKTLHEAWTKWLRPTLEQVIAGSPPPPVAEPPIHLTGGGGPHRLVEPKGDIEYFPLPPRVRKPGQPRYEPSEELTTPVHIALVPGYGTGALC